MSAGLVFVASVAVVLASGVIIGARVAVANQRLDALLAAYWRNEDVCAATSQHPQRSR